MCKAYRILTVFVHCAAVCGDFAKAFGRFDDRLGAGYERAPEGTAFGSPENRIRVSAVVIPVRDQLALQRDNGVKFGVVPGHTVLRGLKMLRLEEEGHPAGELALNGAGSGGDAVGNVLSRQEVVERQPLLVVGKQNIVAQALVIH